MSYAEYLTAHGGIANCGNNLGLMVAPLATAHRCPGGWTFLALEDATPERVQKLLDTAGSREHWPKNER